MIDFTTINKIYIMPGYTDLRLGIDGYAAIVEGKFKSNPFDGSLYVFCNKSRDKIKILHFEYDGFWLYYKRLETGKIKWPKNDEINDIEIRQLRWLLDGLKVNEKAALLIIRILQYKLGYSISVNRIVAALKMCCMATIEKGIVHIVMNENKVKVDRKDIDQEMGKITINETIEDYIMINKLFGNYNIASLVSVDEFKKIIKNLKIKL